MVLVDLAAHLGALKDSPVPHHCTADAGGAIGPTLPVVKHEPIGCGVEEREGRSQDWVEGDGGKMPEFYEIKLIASFPYPVLPSFETYAHIFEEREVLFCDPHVCAF